MSSTPSPAGVLTSGFEYQHTFTWLQALRLLQDGTEIVEVGFEVPGAGNVDDVVVYFANRQPKYHQVKYAQRVAPQLTYEWFMEPLGSSKKTLLQRLYESFEKLTKDGVRPDLALETNRWADPNDPLFGGQVSGRAYKLMPYVEQATSGSPAGEARAEWARHLDIDEDDLFDFLAYLELNPARGSLESLREYCRDLQASVGIRPDDEALDIGVREIGQMIGNGVRSIDAGGMHELVGQRRLGVEHQTGVVVVEAVDYDPWPEAATVSLGWVELFPGDTPGERCQLADESGWNDVLKPGLQQAVAVLRQQGFTDVVVRGFMRLPLWFAVGFHFSSVAGFEVTTRQNGDEWGSRGLVTQVPIDSEVTERGEGCELAVGISIANDVTDEVLPYLEAAGIEVARFINLRLHEATGRHAVTDADEVRGLAQAFRDSIDDAARDLKAERVHLFISAPGGLALLLGHAWGRVPTTVYEHRGTGRSYFPTFEFGA